MESLFDRFTHDFGLEGGLVIFILFGTIGLFFMVVSICVPFWIYAIHRDIKKSNQILESLLAKKNSPTNTDFEMAANIEVMKKIMTGETTPEAERGNK